MGKRAAKGRNNSKLNRLMRYMPVHVSCVTFASLVSIKLKRLTRHISLGKSENRGGKKQ